MQLAKYIPSINWITHYKKEWLKGDLSAGLTVGVMLIPQGMAYAMIAGVEPIYGLYASIVPLIVYAIFGTSRQLAVGPTAMVAMLTAAAIAPLAEGDGVLYLKLAIATALMIGVIQFFMGLFRMGFLSNFLSHPVISGFTSAVAIIIALSQLKHFFGISVARSHYIHEIIYSTVRQYNDFNWISVGIGLGGIAIIFASKKISRSLPGQLFAMIFGIGLVYLLHLDQSGVKILGEVNSSLPSFEIPLFDWGIFQQLLPIALAISLLSFIESYAVSKAVQARHKDYKVDANQELMALGMSNIFGSFFQSFPVTGGFSRTAVNDQAGARTGLAAVISASLVLLALIFLASLFFFLPKAILGAVILVAVIGLIDVKEAIHLWKSDRADFYLLLVTFLSTLTFGITEGIAIGVVLSLATIIYRTTKPHIAVLGKMPKTNIYKNVKRFKKAEVRDDILIVRPDARLYFANISYLKDKIDRLIEKKGKGLKMLIINADSINSIDSSAASMLKDLAEELKKQKIYLVFTGIKGPVRDSFKKSGLTQKVGENQFFSTVKRAIDCYEKEGCEMVDGFSRQTNE